MKWIILIANGYRIGSWALEDFDTVKTSLSQSGFKLLPSKVDSVSQYWIVTKA